MQKGKLVLLLISVVIASIVLTNLIYSFTVVEEENLEMYLTVENYVGFNVDTSAIFFGTVQPGGSSSRDVILTNNHPTPLTVDIRAYGNLSNWIYVSDNGFSIEPNGNKTVKVTAVVPEGAEFGNYTGSLKIIFRKV